MKKIYCILSLLLVLATNMIAQDKLPASAWGNTPPLHIEGKFLCDPYGNHVVPHGVMDTPSCWFNSGRWGWMSYDDANAPKKCREYFTKIYDAMTDTAQGAFCKVFRLHLDPCWLSGSTRAKGFTVKDNKVYDPHGNEVGGEADISKFSKSRFRSFLRSVYVPLALDAIKHGMYVIMRPPGVFPGYVEVGDYYNQYLLDVWDIVSKNDSIKKYSGQISIELGNEPVTLRAKGGASSAKAMHDFFQPIVDRIRENGFYGIIWGVGTGYQSSYQDYDSYPLIGENIGYAVHVYTGWYGASDERCNHQDFINQFGKQVPVVNKYPIIVTEIDWSPGGANYTQNPDGSLKSENYGTWATGTTSKWGKAWRAVHDHYGNIGMTLTSTDDLLDIENYLKTKKVLPAFYNAMNAKGVDPMEACGAACMAWYAEWAKVNYGRPANMLNLDAPIVELAGDKACVMVGQKLNCRFEGKFADGLTSKIPTWLCDMKANDTSLCDMQGDNLVAVKAGTTTATFTFKGNGGEALPKECELEVVPAFSLSEEVINPSILGAGTYTTKRGTMRTAPDGMAGWVFDAGIDLSDYNYLVVEFMAKPQCNAVLCISDTLNATLPLYTVDATSSTVKVDLKNLTKADGTPVDLSNIKIVGFKSNGTKDFYLKNAYVSMDGTTPATSEVTTAVSEIKTNANIVAEEYYNAAGQRIAAPANGINIIRQTLANGKKITKKVIIK